MKNILLLLLFPLMMFAQDSPLVGDVDCDGEVNSQDASLILQFVTGVIDELPCQDNMTGLTPEQLQEMIDMMDEQLNINYTAGSGGGCNLLYPEGLDGESITFSLNPYVVPAGKRLYVLSGINLILNDGAEVLYVDITEGKPGIFNEGDEIWTDNPNNPHSNGILVDASPNLTAISIYSDPSNQYQVPSGKRLYVMSGGNLMLGDVEIDVTDWKPAVFNSGALIYTTQAGDAFNGYLVDEDYFADCSGGGGSTTNSVAETGGSGFDIMFPDGYDGEGVTVNICDSDYIVPEGKTLYITNALLENGGDLLIDTKIIMSNTDERVGPSSPIVVNANQIISSEDCWCNADNVPPCSFSGILVESSDLLGLTHALNDYAYTVPEGKKLYILNYLRPPGGNGDLIINDILVSTASTNDNLHSFQLPIVVNSGDIISESAGVFNGYLVDEDYFSSAGSGSNSNESDVSVSQVGDTLFINGTSIVIPGISINNNSLNTVLDGCGNEYPTYDYGLAGTWMLEDLRTSCYEDGSLITEDDGEYSLINNGQVGLYSIDLVTGPNNLCPAGWHIPTREEWYSLLSMYCEQGSSSSTYCNTPVSPDVIEFVEVSGLLAYDWVTNYPYPNASGFNISNNTPGTGKNYLTSSLTPEACFGAWNEPCNGCSLWYINVNEGISIGTSYAYDGLKCIRCVKD